MNNIERPAVKIPFCAIHMKKFNEVDGMGGERFIECPVGGWDCPVTWLVITNDTFTALNGGEVKVAQSLE